VQWPNTSALQQCFEQNAFCTAHCCCAKQVHSRVVSVQLHLWTFALHTGVQWPNTGALHQCFEKNAFSTAQCCYAKQVHSRVCQCNYIYGDLPSIQMCSDPAATHCSTGFAKIHFPLSSAALQNRLTAVILSLPTHLWRFVLHAGLRWLSSNALQPSFGKTHLPLFGAAPQSAIGDIALILACSEPILQSNPEHWGMQIALTSVAVHWYWVTAHLDEQQMSIGVIALTLACSEPVSQSSTEQ